MANRPKTLKGGISANRRAAKPTAVVTEVVMRGGPRRSMVSATISRAGRSLSRTTASP